MKKLLVRGLLVLVVLVVIALVVVTVSLGSLVKKGVETVGPALTKTELRLDSASLSILSGSGTLRGLFVGNPEGFKTPSAIKVGAISLGVEPGTVFRDKVHVRHLRVEAPDITFEGSLKGNNLSKILENVEAAVGGGASDKSPQAKGAAKKLQVDEVTITGGKIHLSATLMGGKAVPLPLPDIQLKDLGQGPEGITAAELTGKLLSAITKGTLQAVEKGALDLGKGAVDAASGAVKGAAEGLKDATKGIGDLFKKK